ncbi:MAG: DMT family transporter [Chloroflexi bacterium]|nr:DMT family transporter [Chloroflexota bacterium]
MLEKVVTFFIGILGGLAVGLQSPIAGGMSQQIGGAASSLIVHVSGAVFSALLLVARGGENIGAWRSLPWYMLASGVFGLILYLTLGHTLPRLGAGAALALIILGQLLMGLLIDQFGWFNVTPRPIDLTRVLAVVLLLAGGYLMTRA